jgi:hypothetical protein
MGHAALRTHGGLEDQGRAPSRSDVLTRYRHLREISKRHHSEVLKFVPQNAILQHARRLSLAVGKTLMLDNIDEMTLVFDLACRSLPCHRPLCQIGIVPTEHR